MKRFALIGAAGYIAPRHMQAIQATGHDLVAITDPHDNVGIIDRYFPQARYFREFERFDRHLDKLRRNGKAIDYLVVCSPNYLHDAHCRYGMRIGVDVICEKPLVLNPWNVDGLLGMQGETGKRVYNILQLRLHPYFAALKRQVVHAPHQRYEIDLRYVTSRGAWYVDSWKGEISKSGGMITNIGIHLFDVLLWIFGEVVEYAVDQYTQHKASGQLVLQQAHVQWFLSIDRQDIPYTPGSTPSTVYRSINIDGEKVAFDSGFEDLHTASYINILQGKGFGISDVRKAIDLVSQLRNVGKDK